MNLHWILRPSQQPDCGSRTRLPPPAHKASRYGFLPGSRLRDPDIRYTRNHRRPAPSRRASTRGNRKPVTGKVAGSAIRAGALRCVAVFRGGDEACFRRNGGPGGRSVCASRFRLDPTHSLLLWRHLGRNLITLFSTVNTPREKKSRDAPPRSTARAVDRRMRTARPRAPGTPTDRHARKKTSFFQRFYLRNAARAACPHRSDEATATSIRCAYRQVNAALSSIRRMVVFPCRASPIARKCANFSTRFAVPKRCLAGVERWIATRSATRTAPAPTHATFPIRVASASETAARRTRDACAPSTGAQRKSRSRTTRAASGGPDAHRTAPARGECGLSGRRLPAVRRSRPARADR